MLKYEFADAVSHGQTGDAAAGRAEMIRDASPTSRPSRTDCRARTVARGLPRRRHRISSSKEDEQNEFVSS